MAHGNLTWDAGRKMYFNDPGNDPSRREWFNRQCCKVFPNGALNCDWFGDICPPDKPCQSPVPSPVVTPPPSPTSQPTGAPPLDATGNYPMPPDGVCPPWFKDSLHRVGIHVAGQVPCQQQGNCRRVTLWATQKSVPPYCPHAPDRRECEMWRPCQEPQFIDYVGGDPENPGGGIIMQIAHPDWNNVWGRLDKQTCDPRHNACPPGMTNPVHNFNGHDRAVDRSGVTRARACMPDGTKCSETSYRTDQ